MLEFIVLCQFDICCLCLLPVKAGKAEYSAGLRHVVGTETMEFEMLERQIQQQSQDDDDDDVVWHLDSEGQRQDFDRSVATSIPGWNLDDITWGGLTDNI